MLIDLTFSCWQRLLSSVADSHCKRKFGPRSGPTFCWSCSWIHTLGHPDSVTERIFEKVNSGNSADDNKSMKNYAVSKELSTNFRKSQAFPS